MSKNRSITRKTPAIIAGKNFSIITDNHDTLWVSVGNPAVFRRMGIGDQMIAMSRGIKPAIMESLVRTTFDARFNDVLTQEEWEAGTLPTNDRDHLTTTETPAPPAIAREVIRGMPVITIMQHPVVEGRVIVLSDGVEWGTFPDLHAALTQLQLS